MAELVYTTQELKQATKKIIEDNFRELYRAEIVTNDRRTKSRPFYKTKEGDAFCEVITGQVLSEREKFCTFDTTNLCKYKIGYHNKRLAELKSTLTSPEAILQHIEETNRKEERIMHCICAQDRVGEFFPTDYQIPTRDGGHNKIDLLLKNASGDIYITEAKKIGSDESFLRCALEIQTYYTNLTKVFLQKNGWEIEKVKKAVLFDKDSFAYTQIEHEGWAKDLQQAFDIHVLILSHDDNWQFNIEEYLG